LEARSYIGEPLQRQGLPACRCGPDATPPPIWAKSPWKRADFPPSGIVLPCPCPARWLRLAATSPPLVYRCGWGWVLAPYLFVGQGRSRCGEHNEGNSSIKQAQKGPGSGFCAGGGFESVGLFGHRRHVWRRRRNRGG